MSVSTEVYFIFLQGKPCACDLDAIYYGGPVKRAATFRNRKNALVPGYVSEDQFWLLIEISPINSEKVIMALRDYLVSGRSRKECCDVYSVNTGYFSTSLHRLYYISEKILQLMPYYSELAPGEFNR